MCMDGLLIRVPLLRLRDICTSTLVINLCKVGVGPQVCKPVINCWCCVLVFRFSFVIESVMQNQHMWQALPAQLAFSAFLSYDLVECRLSPIPFRSQTLSMCMFSCSWLSRSQLHTASVTSRVSWLRKACLLLPYHKHCHSLPSLVAHELFSSTARTLACFSNKCSMYFLQ
jgi:hypothetical protein